ncbi:MAG: efflux RND transporter permease subunit [Candidatus Competibacteraceae bacterium]
MELRVRAAPRTVARVREVLDDPIALPGGGTTTLAALLVTEERKSLGLIRHWNLRRAITVEAIWTRRRPIPWRRTIDCARSGKKIRARYPRHQSRFSGELDDINESLEAMGPLFLLGVGLIYLILATQFRSYFQPLLILVTVPLAFTGVTLGLLVSGNPLSLYTLYGIIALTGIAVNAAIVLIDAANARRTVGMSTLHATLYAARRRVIAILMTTGTTIAGLFSLAFGLAGSRCCGVQWRPARLGTGLFHRADAVRDPGAVPVLHASAAGGSAALVVAARGISSASTACVSRCFTTCSRFSISRSIASGSSRNRLISQGSSSRRSSRANTQQEHQGSRVAL